MRVSPTRGVQRFGIKGKLAPRYIGPFEIIETCGPVAYRIRLPSQLAAIHDVFHISQLKKCIKMPTEIIKPQDIEIETAIYLMLSIQSEFLKPKKEVSEGRRLECTKSSGIIILRKKPLGRLKLISKEIFSTFLEPIKVPNLSILFFL